jgi:hypothetical protein
MEIIESMMWVLAGFVPTLAGLEILYRLRKETRKIGISTRKLEVIA